MITGGWENAATAAPQARPRAPGITDWADPKTSRIKNTTRQNITATAVIIKRRARSLIASPSVSPERLFYPAHVT